MVSSSRCGIGSSAASARYGTGASSIGDHASGPWRTVVGVVGDVDHSEIGGPRRPAMYLP
ncbi:MAG: hypothetical protein ABIS06_10160 [Vicinamibacterales bacterium]